MALITTGGSGNWSSTTPNAPWPGGTKPVAGDTVEIAAGHTVTLDQDTPVLGAAGISSGSGILSINGTWTINGSVSYSGTSTSGLCRIDTGDALTIIGGGAGDHCGVSEQFGVRGRWSGKRHVDNLQCRWCRGDHRWLWTRHIVGFDRPAYDHWRCVGIQFGGHGVCGRCGERRYHGKLLRGRFVVRDRHLGQPRFRRKHGKHCRKHGRGGVNRQGSANDRNADMAGQSNLGGGSDLLDPAGGQRNRRLGDGGEQAESREQRAL